MAGFICGHCGREVAEEALGTKHRNHCPYCLWSKHLDLNLPGDRRSGCEGEMKPSGLAFKREGGRKVGELMVVHECERCGQRASNRIAGDDVVEAILAVYEASLRRPKEEGLLAEKDRREIMTQLFGRPNLPTQS